MRMVSNFTILGPECTKYQNKLLRVVSVDGTTVQRRSFAAASPAGSAAAAGAPVLESAEAWRQRLQAPSSFAGSETIIEFGLIFLPHQPDSRYCILFNTCRTHLIYE